MDPRPSQGDWGHILVERAYRQDTSAYHCHKLVVFEELSQGTLHNHLAHATWAAQVTHVCVQVRQLHLGTLSQAHRCPLLWDQEREVRCNNWEGW